MGEFQRFTAHLTDPRAQNVETLQRDISPDLNLTADIDLNMLSID